MGAVVISTEPDHCSVGALEQLDGRMCHPRETGVGVAFAALAPIGSQRLHGPRPARDAVEGDPAALGQWRPVDQSAHQGVHMLAELNGLREVRLVYVRWVVVYRVRWFALIHRRSRACMTKPHWVAAAMTKPMTRMVV